MIPSVKTLKAITSYPRELRLLLEAENTSQLYAWLDSDKPFGRSSQFGRFRDITSQFHNSPSFHHLKMLMANELCETHGIGYIPAGHNSKSPAIEYLNTGDTYAATLLWVKGRYCVGCWGDIVERGNYE